MRLPGKDSYRRDLVKIQSGRLVCGYIYASAGEGESSTDLVFGGHHLIAENGSVLAESERFTNETIYGDLDIERLVGERRHYTTYDVTADADGYMEVEYEMASADASFDRYVDKAPFVPGRKEEREKRCEEILAIQSMGLKKRMEHTHCKSVVIGISGGLVPHWHFWWQQERWIAEPAENLYYRSDHAMLWNHGPYLQ